MTRAEGELSPGEWAVLALCDEEPAHGFGLAQALAPAGPVGRVWAVPRPLVYRALHRLREIGLVEELGTRPSASGPPKTAFAATARARARVDAWLQEPVEHVRDARHLLLLKLLFLERRGRDPTPLVDAQTEAYDVLQRRLEDRIATAEGFDRVLLSWRLESARAALRFLGGLPVSPR
jgi:DNA-binding PadR family transcriptional regulator